MIFIGKKLDFELLRQQNHLENITQRVVIFKQFMYYELCDANVISSI